MKEKNQIDHYANALYSIWFDLNAKDKITFTSSAKDIYFSLKNNFEIINILNSNIIFSDEKRKILAKIFNDLNSSNLPNQYLYNFLFVLIDNKFFSKVLEIFISFFEKLDEYENFVFLRVYSPFTVDEQLLKKIEKLFSIKTKKKVRYESIIDKNLIGGMKIAFGNEIFDYSIKGKIDQIKWNLENTKKGEL
ncbi:MAG: ATP synthase F1 subunit delta [Malacoplasma sp.]|nr:ATP synthase F1 subunit delta [Malacoplasma sp.]